MVKNSNKSRQHSRRRHLRGGQGSDDNSSSFFGSSSGSSSSSGFGSGFGFGQDSSASSSSSSSSSSSEYAATGAFALFAGWNVQKIALFIAVIAFIVILGGMAYMLWKATNSTAWPPNKAACPDHFVLDNNNKCVDVHRLLGPDAQGNAKSFPLADAALYPDTCSKQRWAARQSYANMSNTMGIAWDGVDQNSNPSACS